MDPAWDWCSSDRIL